MQENYISPELANFGQAMWLCMNSKLHVKWRLGLFINNILPPIQNKQFHFIHKNNQPVAFVSWAFFSKEAEYRYIINPSEIRSSDWQSGDRLWFIDFISPFSTSNTFEMKQWLADHFPNRYARALRVRLDSDTGSIRTFFNRNKTAAMRRQADEEILTHFASKRIEKENQ